MIVTRLLIANLITFDEIHILPSINAENIGKVKLRENANSNNTLVFTQQTGMKEFAGQVAIAVNFVNGYLEIYSPLSGAPRSNVFVGIIYNF